MKRLLIFPALLLLTFIGYGQYIVTQPQSYWFGIHWAKLLAFEDLDNDGYLDMTLAGDNSRQQTNVSIAFNDGSGNFGSWQMVSSATMTEIGKMQYGFLRGITERDLVVAFSTHTEVLWNVNNTLSIQQNDLPQGTLLALGRVDNNIYDDLALVTYAMIEVFKNTGGGTFNTTSIQTISEDPGFIRLMDLDNDQMFFDLVTRVGSNVNIRKNNNGTLGSPVSINVGSVMVMELGDVSNDGYPDLLVISSDEYLRIYLNDGQGNIHNTPAYEIYSNEFNSLVSLGDIAIGDMNNDGWNDLVVASYEGRTTIWINTTSAPLFQDPPQQTISGFIIYEPIPSLALVDIENTGGLAVTMSSLGEYNPAAHIFKHDGNPAPAPPKNLTVSGQAGQHPFLQWDANTERDMSQYKVYKSYNNSSFSLLTTVPSTQTYYEDVSETVITGWPQANERRAYYKITAVDDQSQESNFSNTVKIRVEGPNLEKVGTGSDQPIAQVPEAYSLLQNYPNPFNPTTTVEFQIPEENQVELAVFSLAGQKIAVLVNEVLDAGAYRFQWDGRDGQGNPVSSGVYIYRMISGEHRLVKKMMLIK